MTVEMIERPYEVTAAAPSLVDAVVDSLDSSELAVAVLLADVPLVDYRRLTRAHVRELVAAGIVRAGLARVRELGVESRRINLAMLDASDRNDRKALRAACAAERRFWSPIRQQVAVDLAFKILHARWGAKCA